MESQCLAARATIFLQSTRQLGPLVTLLVSVLKLLPGPSKGDVREILTFESELGLKGVCADRDQPNWENGKDVTKLGQRPSHAD